MGLAPFILHHHSQQLWNGDTLVLSGGGGGGVNNYFEQGIPLPKGRKQFVAKPSKELNSRLDQWGNIHN